MRLRADLSSSMDPVPGNLFCIVHVDSRNRVAELESAQDLGGPMNLSGFQAFNDKQLNSLFISDQQAMISPDGTQLLRGGWEIVNIVEHRDAPASVEPKPVRTARWGRPRILVGVIAAVTFMVGSGLTFAIDHAL